MMTFDLNSRKKLFSKLSAYLAELDTKQLHSLFDNDDNESHGWGTNHVIHLEKSKLFVKRVPLTDIEYAHMFSTKNLYNLPTYYNYGVSSAGFGVFRELLTNIKTTNWVLDSSLENFPLMFHYRICPRIGNYSAVDGEKHARYVEYWNNNENIGKFMIDRINAKYEILMFFEYIPTTLWDWLGENMGQVDMVLEQTREIINFLQTKGIIHLDLHFENIVTDGEKLFLTDFGLVLDNEFELSQSEKSFFHENRFYDYGVLFIILGWYMYKIFNRLDEEKQKQIMQKYGISEDMSMKQKYQIFLENIESLYDDGIMGLNKKYIDAIIKYRDISIFMYSFFIELRESNQKNARYNHIKLQRLLQESGFLDK